MGAIEEPVKTSVVDDCAVLRLAALGSHALPARRGGRRRIVAPDGSQIAPTTRPQPDGTLVKALARAWRWQRMLDEGVYASVSEVEAILDGRQPKGLRLAELLGNGPVAWEEQRSAWGLFSVPSV